MALIIQTRSAFCEEGKELWNITQKTFKFQQILVLILISTFKITVKIQQLSNCSPLPYAQNLPLSINCLHSFTVYCATHLYKKDELKHVLKYTRSLSQYSLTIFSCLTLPSCCRRCNRYHIYFQTYFISSHVTETRRNDHHYQLLILVAIT